MTGINSLPACNYGLLEVLIYSVWSTAEIGGEYLNGFIAKDLVEPAQLSGANNYCLGKTFVGTAAYSVETPGRPRGVGVGWDMPSAGRGDGSGRTAERATAQVTTVRTWAYTYVGGGALFVLYVLHTYAQLVPISLVIVLAIDNCACL
jgi:hypothetical protein